jgi:branched-chain amino acid transport system permease protein
MKRTLGLVALLFATAALLAAPVMLGRYGNLVLANWLVIAIAAMGVNLIMGYAGQETLAQAGFMGIGAYTSALMIKGGTLTVLGATLTWAPFSIFSALAVSGLLAFLLGILIGFPALRVQKHYLAFVTLAFTVFLWLVFRNEDWLTGGVFGIQDIKRPSVLGIEMSPSRTYYHRYSYFVIAVTALLTAIMWFILRSPWGRAFTALRENAIRAESLGVDVRGYKLLAFAVGSAYGGFAGALYAPLVEFIDPSPFSLAPSLLFLLMIVVGGMGYFVGPFIGAGVAVVLPLWIERGQGELVAKGYQFLSHFSYVIIFALVVILMIALAPKGIAGLIDSLFTRARRPHADVKGPVLGELKS